MFAPRLRASNKDAPIKQIEPTRTEQFKLGDIDRAPYRVALAWRKSDLVGVIFNAFAHAINPAEAQCLINGLGPGHTGFSGCDFVKANDQRGAGCRVLAKPLTELRAAGEKLRRLRVRGR